jgi:hypothetical protein
MESLRREPTKVPRDDIDTVVANKQDYVCQFIAAFLHIGYAQPPAQRNSKDHRSKKIAVNLSDDEKAEWVRWQDDQVKKVNLILSLPCAMDEIETRSWELVDEIIAIHQLGCLSIDQSTDSKLKCSERIDLTIQTMKDFAIVRAKLLDEYNIGNFCADPAAYAKDTVKYLWTDYNRARAAGTVRSQNKGRSGTAQNGAAEQRRRTTDVQKAAAVTAALAIRAESSGLTQAWGK